MEIKIVKLVSGEELITEIKTIGETYTTISNPLVVVTAPDGGGGVGIALMEWMPFAITKEVNISNSQIICSLEAEQDLVNGYNEKFGSGIQIVGDLSRGNLEEI